MWTDLDKSYGAADVSLREYKSGLMFIYLKSRELLKFFDGGNHISQIL